MVRHSLVHIQKLLLILSTAVAVVAVPVNSIHQAVPGSATNRDVRAGKIVLAQFVPCPNGKCEILAPVKQP